MSFEEQLNISTQQLEHLVKSGVNIPKLAGDGFHFDPEMNAGLDTQIDIFAESLSPY